jgi:hypothetical protein
MKYAVLLAASAALALTACEKAEEGEATPAASEAAAPEAAVPETAAAAPAGAAAFTAGQPPSKEFMVGTWGEGDGCELPINFEADGTTKDGPFEKWDIQNGALVMDGEQTMKLKVIDANTMESSNDSSGKVHTLKRC